ncbi:AAA family ATPase, partial [Kineococcus sp. TRM81007]|uniref:BTAD domain-containing putative transcriptional regulator n=1 Tax=Kineococcus sp. TRM81007 TaxID=2925831 RepID=UPI001F58499E
MSPTTPCLQLAEGFRTTRPDGASATLSGAQAQVAAARLLLDRSPRGVSRSELAEAIWSEDLPDTWASALRSIVTRVRRFLAAAGEGASLENVDGRYVVRLPAGTVVDVEVALAERHHARELLERGEARTARELAERCVRVLSRPFLPDHDSPWVHGVRADLAERCSSAREVAVAAAAACGDTGAAVEHARAAVAAAPLREAAHRSLVQAHLAAGDRGQALSAYSRLRAVLRDELGVDPSPESQELHVEALGGPAADGPAALLPAPRRPQPFVGRRAQLQRLDELERSVRGGSPALALVRGELGIGKSRLLREFARRAARRGT